MPLPLHSGADWEPDPQPNTNSHEGRTDQQDMRDKNDFSRIAVVKRPKPQYATVENYSIGMERASYTLARQLDLPVPETWLDNVNGFDCSVQRRVPHSRTWRQVEGGVPQMRTSIENKDVFPLAALFDIWMANTDRRDNNLLLEALPEGSTPGRARSSRLWLIDHGQCGLWPANQFDLSRDAEDIPTDPADAQPLLVENAEKYISTQMPPEYRMAVKNSQGDDRQVLLDQIRSIEDDDIRGAVNEVPEEYISADRKEATVAFLKGRRDALDTVLNTYW